MPERLHPGVYVEEVSSGVRPIEAASTSTAAFVGLAEMGICSTGQCQEPFFILMSLICLIMMALMSFHIVTNTLE